MKMIFRTLMLGILMTAFTAAVVTPSFAQDPTAEKQALYKKYTDNYAGTIDQKKIAIDAAKEYVQKYGANAEDKEQVDYFQKALPALEDSIRKVEEGNKKDALFKRFDTCAKGNDVACSFATGKEILVGSPDFIDVVLVLASMGYEQAILPTPVDTYNSDAVNYAKMAIQKIEAGKPSITKDYGAINWAYRNDNFPDGKSNALGSMNYDIGYIMYYRQNQKKEAIPYFYKSLQYNSPAKNNPLVYQIIGASYFDEAKRLSQETDTKLKAAGGTDTDETKSLYALAKGNADRAIDAYARAYKIAGSNPATKKEYKDGLYKVLQDLYKFRYDGKIEGLDAFVATVTNKPMADPATAVTPVVETTPAATTSSMSATSNTTVEAAPQTSGSSAAKSGTAGTAASKTTTTTTSNGETTVKTKTTVKKPAPKKKGRR